MISAEVTVTVDNFDIAREAFDDAINKALEAIGMQAENYAKMLCPVDTGNLRNSITHRQENENTEVIGTAVEYAP